ncbi:MAG: hypothetical protein WKF97_19795 [Chitinophagaceae bacterium]
MEKNVLNLSSMKVNVKSLTLLALIMVSSFLAVSANETSPIANNSEIAVSPEGVIEEEMIFNVQYYNANGDKLSIKILDESGLKLYSNAFTGKNLNKTFKVPADLGKVYLIIQNTVNQIEQKFVISTKNADQLLITSAF